MTVHVVLVFDPETGDFDRVAGVYTSRADAELVKGDARWYWIEECKVDMEESFV